MRVEMSLDMAVLGHVFNAKGCRIHIPECRVIELLIRKSICAQQEGICVEYQTNRQFVVIKPI